jgi:hypothetical protein
MARSAKTKRTVFINDTHCGSNYGLMSDDAQNEDGRSVGMSYQQGMMLDHWKEVAKRWRDPDCIVFNGDLIDGSAKADRGSSVWTVNMDTQAQDFKKLFSYWGKPKKLFAVIGTPYHVNVDAIKIEEQIARDLGAEREMSRYATEAKLINLAPDSTYKTENERIVHVAHHMGSTKVWMYRGTAPSRSMAMIMLNESHFLERKRKIFGIVRAHVHHYWQEKSTNRLMQVLPCYQLQTPFMYKIMPESPPDLGSVQYTFHEDGTWEDEHAMMKTKITRPKVHQA